MSSFFQHQLDYIFFFYGLGFILLAAVCVAMHRTGSRRLPWVWLGLFGLTHGLGEWLDLIAISFGDSTGFMAARLMVMGISFAFLTEFARRGTIYLRGAGPGLWVYLPLLALGLSGAFWSMPAMNATLRYAFGFIGGSWSAWMLFKASRAAKEGGNLLWVASLILAAYAVMSGAIVPAAPFAPASIVNHAAFLAALGIPVQLVRGTLAVVLTAIVWTYFQRSWSKRLTGYGWQSSRIYEPRLAIAFMVIIAAGWIFTDLFARNIDQMLRSNLINQTVLAAEAIDHRRVQDLSDKPASGEDPDLLQLEQQLTDMSQASTRIIAMSLLLQDSNGTVRILADSEPEDQGDESDDGGPNVKRSPVLTEVFDTGEAATDGPFLIDDKSLMTGYDALRERETGDVVAVMRMDVDAAYFHETIAIYRLAPISITLLISLIAIGTFLTRHGFLESARRISDSEAKLKEAQRLASLGSWTYELETNRVTCSREMLRILARDQQQECSFREFKEFVHPQDRKKLESAITIAIKTGEKRETELQLIRPDSTVRNVVTNLELKRGSKGEVVQVLGTAHDISERKQMEDALKQSEQRMRLHVEQTPLGVIEWDTEFRVVRWNPAAEHIFGYTREEALGRHISFLVTDKSDSFKDPAWKNLLSGRSSMSNITRDGRAIVCEWYNTPLTTRDGRVIGIASLAEDITERIEAEERLRELSLTDEMTGLNNRRGFLTLAAQQIKNSLRFGKKVVLIYADMDGLKYINDNHGHAVGDQAIQDLAHIMKGSFRSSDVTARLGGDEFAALALETEDQDAKSVLSRLQENIINLNMTKDRPYTLSVSFGVTWYDPENPCSLSDLLERGDEMMYIDKLKKSRRSA